MTERTKKTGAVKAAPKPQRGRIELGPDVARVVLPDGFIVDDTAYFRGQELVRPIRAALAKSKHLKQLRARRQRAFEAHWAGRKTDEDVALLTHWIEEFMINTCASLLDRAKRASTEKRGRNG